MVSGPRSSLLASLNSLQEAPLYGTAPAVVPSGSSATGGPILGEGRQREQVLTNPMPFSFSAFLREGVTTTTVTNIACTYTVVTFSCTSASYGGIPSVACSINQAVDSDQGLRRSVIYAKDPFYANQSGNVPMSRPILQNPLSTERGFPPREVLAEVARFH